MALKPERENRLTFKLNNFLFSVSACSNSKQNYKKLARKILKKDTNLSISGMSLTLQAKVISSEDVIP